MTPDQIDRLAAFCRFHERGWKSTITGRWYRTTEPAREWRPDESDDDCRVVLEAVPEKDIGKLLDAMYDLSGADDDRYDMIEYLAVFDQFLLFATPAEKCQAVLRVLEDA